MKNFVKVFGTVVLTVAMLFALVSCSNGGGGGGGGGSIPAPNNVTGFFGVTSDGRTIEVVNTTANPGRSISTTGWATGNGYAVFINGSETSRGTITISGSNISFTPATGDVVSLNTSNGEITVGSVSGTVAAAEPDRFFAIGAGTRMTEAQIKANAAGKTPEQFLVWALNDGYYEFYNNDWEDGSWATIVTKAKEYNCPDSVLTKASNDLKDRFSGWGYFYDNSERCYIVFYISRVDPDNFR